MLIRLDSIVERMPGIGNEGPGKIHGFVLFVHDDFDGTGVVILVFSEGRRHRCHHKRFVFFKSLAQGIDDFRCNERLISLDVDDDIGIRVMAHGFGQTVRPVGMVFPGHDGMAAKGDYCIIYAGIIDCHDDGR